MASLFKNTGFMLVASVGQKIISLVYFALIARLLGPEQTGLYTSVLATTTIAVVFVDLGLTNVFIRDTARAPERLPVALGHLLVVKIATSLLSYIGLVAAVYWSGFEAAFLWLTVISGITMLFDSLHLTLYGALRVQGELKFEAIGMVMSQAITLVIGGLALWLWHGPVYVLMLAFLAASVLNAVYAWYQLRRNANIRIQWQWPGEQFKVIAIAALPFALAAIFNRIYSYLDVLMLKKLAGNTATALYSTPSKLTYAFQFIPMALVAALYPRLSEYFHKDKIKYAQSFTDSLVYLMLIVTPITLGLYWLAEPITLFLFGEEYRGAIVPMQILAMSLVWAFAAFPVGALLNASNRQTHQTFLTGVVLLVNVGLNVWLIPRYGAVAAAWTTLVGNVMLTLGGYLAMPRDSGISHRVILVGLLKIILAGAVMSIAVLTLRAQWHFIIVGIIGVVFYTLIVLLLHVIPAVHLTRIINRLRRQPITPTV